MNGQFLKVVRVHNVPHVVELLLCRLLRQCNDIAAALRTDDQIYALNPAYLVRGGLRIATCRDDNRVRVFAARPAYHLARLTVGQARYRAGINHIYVRPLLKADRLIPFF